MEACQGDVIRTQDMEAKVCIHIYIYLQAQQNRYLGSWCIFGGLKVEHTITHT